MDGNECKHMYFSKAIQLDINFKDDLSSNPNSAFTS